jgi:hypothetical protein
MINERLPMTNTTTFADLLAAANETNTGRSPGQWTPAACRVWREADPEMARLLEAALAWELATGRTATAGDEALVRERRAAIDAATAKGTAAG